MNESAARNTLLVRAFETSADDERWNDADRSWANRAALEVIDHSPAVAADDFVARRARLGAQRLIERDSRLARLRNSLTWRAWVGPVLIALAFLLGLATDAIGPAKRINLLAPPLLGILLWNVVVYLLMAGASLWSVFKRPDPLSGPLNRLVARLANGALGETDEHGPDAVFARDWISASSPLTGARVAGILHYCAAAIAAGALTALYVRGFALEYQAGWESTFLDANAVHQLLSLLFAPATFISGLPLPDADALAAMQFKQGGGVNAAPWIHMYALTLGLFVVVPRILLGLFQTVRAARLRRRFPLQVDSPYFESLARVQRGESARVIVLPYSYHPAGTASDVLSRVLGRVHGAAAEIEFAAPLNLGDEDELTLPPAEQTAALAVALFALTATPEAETHGAFIEVLRDTLPAATVLLILVDESGFRKRFSGQTDRLEQRQAAWRKMLAACGQTPVFVELSSAALSQCERTVRTALHEQTLHAGGDGAIAHGIASHAGTKNGNNNGHIGQTQAI